MAAVRDRRELEEVLRAPPSERPLGLDHPEDELQGAGALREPIAEDLERLGRGRDDLVKAVLGELDAGAGEQDLGPVLGGAGPGEELAGRLGRGGDTACGEEGLVLDREELEGGLPVLLPGIFAEELDPLLTAAQGRREGGAGPTAPGRVGGEGGGRAALCGAEPGERGVQVIDRGEEALVAGRTGVDPPLQVAAEGEVDRLRLRWREPLEELCAELLMAEAQAGGAG